MVGSLRALTILPETPVPTRRLQQFITPVLRDPMTSVDGAMHVGHRFTYRQNSYTNKGGNAHKKIQNPNQSLSHVLMPWEGNVHACKSGSLKKGGYWGWMLFVACYSLLTCKTTSVCFSYSKSQKAHRELCSLSLAPSLSFLTSKFLANSIFLIWSHSVFLPLALYF